MKLLELGNVRRRESRNAIIVIQHGDARFVERELQRSVDRNAPTVLQHHDEGHKRLLPVMGPKLLVIIVHRVSSGMLISLIWFWRSSRSPCRCNMSDTTLLPTDTASILPIG